MIIRNYDYEVQTSYIYITFNFHFLIIMFYVTDLIKKLELHLVVTFIFNKD